MTNKEIPKVAWRAIDNLVVVFHGPTSPTDEEWIEYLKTWEVLLTTYEKPICLVMSAGGGPNAAQRQASADLAKRVGKEAVDRSRTAVLVDSRIARGIVTVFRWLGILTLKALPKSDLEGALKYAGLSASHKERIQTIFDELQAQVTDAN